MTAEGTDHPAAVSATGPAAIAVGGDVTARVISTRNVERHVHLGPTIIGSPRSAGDGPVEILRTRLTAELDRFLRNVDKHPAQLPVRWRLLQHGVEQWANVVQTPVGDTAEPPPTLAGTAGVLDLFDRIGSHRLVLVGPGGAGKTVLAARLCLTLLARRDGPVPVILSTDGWDTGRMSLRDWLVSRLRQLFDTLRVPVLDEPDLAVVLLEKGLILPVLDGLDELPEPHSRAALRELNFEHRLPMIVTVREDRFAELTADGTVLAAAAGVRLEPLSVADVAAYLPRTTNRIAEDGRGVWAGVLDRLRDDPAQEQLRQVLANPLMVSMAAAVYATGRNPAELLAPAFADAAAVEKHLLRRFLTACYPAIARDRYRRRRGDFACRPDQATKWLSWLAGTMHTQRSRDLAWWRLADAVPDSTRRGLFTVLVVSTSAACGAAYGPFTPGGAVRGLLSGLFMGMLVALAYPQLSRWNPGLIRYDPRLNTSPGRAVRGSLLAVWFGVGLGLFVGGVRGALVVGVTLGLMYFLTSFFVSRVDPGLVTSPVRLLTLSRTTFLINVGAGVVLSTIGAVLLGQLAPGMLAVGLPIMLLCSEWGRWALFARCWLPLRGRLPWRIQAFLADARARGVLRQVGGVYQFRHSRLLAAIAARDISER
ncbi:NACHT domain-containing protein [Actinoplanes sp. NPDC051859]|uniref:NACHT domain-containing protein n=1 Tax=Actinoplanes sp. NPDC051859 TaxID=3363909 RepID=UPI0037A8CCA8